jgi:hypothetical protein
MKGRMAQWVKAEKRRKAWKYARDYEIIANRYK